MHIIQYLSIDYSLKIVKKYGSINIFTTCYDRFNFTKIIALNYIAKPNKAG